MAYHTVADLQAKVTQTTLVELTDDEGTGAVVTAIAEGAGTTAQNIIDGYLIVRYTLPLATVPGVLREISLVLAIYDLYQRRLRQDMPESVVKDQRNAIGILEHIREGKIPLFEDDKGSLFLTNKTAEDREFPKSVLDAF